MRLPLEWLKEFVDLRIKPSELAHVLTMGGLEVEGIEQIANDSIFEIGVTPNRADCLSIIGIARDVAALTGAKFKATKIRAPQGLGKIDDYAKVVICHPKRCPRYSARVINDIKIAPSPSWIVKRLSSAGVRSINNVVDATNYVMLELGQPLHAFDLKFLNKGKIVVQQAGAKKFFDTLDGTERSLVEDDLLICDGSGPVAIAGVMGGENSEVRMSTTSILLESAFFEPTGVRRTSKRLGLATESSRRFERGIDPNGTLNALHRLTEIILEIAGGKATADWIDIYPKKILPKKLTLSENEVERILGIRPSSTQIAKILSELGIKSEKTKSGEISSVVPTFRPDIERAIDLIEEVARINGYDKIPETMPEVKVRPISRQRFGKLEGTVRETLINAGLSEAVLYGFTSDASLEPFAEISSDSISVTNPLSLEQSKMRTTLLPGLLDALKLNVNRQCADCRLFAMQRVFHRPISIGPSEEPQHVAGIISGKRFPGAWERSKDFLDFYDAKGIVENVLSALGLDETKVFQRGEPYGFLHPGLFANVICDGKRLGFVGSLHPSVIAKWDISSNVFVFELCLEKLEEQSLTKTPKFSELSRFPFVERDLAILIGRRVPAVEVEKVINDCKIPFIGNLRIFDVYSGKGIDADKKSIGLTFKFVNNDKTMTDNEVSESLEKIVKELKTKLGAELRT